ncbi:MAG: cytochrome C [Desulfobulbaceae bacterium A2]|nr:MAG: cytochrome C [Desulfobulbaceae bacterium A2]
MKKLLITLAVVVGTGASQAQGAEITWQKDIKPLFDRNCVTCHGQDSPEHDEFAKDKKGWSDKGIGMRMDSYSHLITYVGWPYSGALMRRLDDGTSKADKKPGNMYEHLGDTEAERQANLALFKGWVGNWNAKRWSDLTKEELGALQIKY